MADREPRRESRHPHTRLGKRASLLSEHGARGAIGEQPAIRGEHDDAVHERQPHVDAMLDDDECRPCPIEHALDRGAHLGNARGVEVRRRLIEQKKARSHREHTCEGEALLLSTAERCGRPVELDLEANVGERLVHPLPDLLAGNPEVLAAEGHIVADLGEDDLAVGVLQHEPGVPPGLRWRTPVDEEFPLRLAVVASSEHARERLEQGRLACAGCPEQQHALARLDVEVEVAHGPPLAGGVPPSPPAGSHASRREHPR